MTKKICVTISLRDSVALIADPQLTSTNFCIHSEFLGKETMQVSDEITQVDVVVIGAGISGLCAASRILRRKPHLKVAILEARDRVGGRTCTEVTSHGGKCDVGGAYVGPTQDRILRVAEQVGVDTYPIYYNGNTIFHDSKTGKFLKGTVDLPPLSVIELLDFNNVLVSFENLVQDEIEDTGLPWWENPNAKNLDNLTFQDWVNNTAKTETVKHLGAKFVDTILCHNASEVSMLYFLWGARSGGTLRRILQLENGAQERKFTQGSMAISTRLAEKLGEGVLHLECAVESINQEYEGVTVTCRNRRKFQCKRVITALAPPLYKSICWSPELPTEKLHIANEFRMGHIIKTNMYYDRALWREKGLNGQVYKPGAIVLFSMDDTKPDGSFPSIMGFVLSDTSKEVAKLSREERMNLIAKQYAEMFEDDFYLHPVAYQEKDWNSEEFSGGGYVAVPTVGSFQQAGPHLQETFDKVHFAGTETATKWAGYMDGAVQAGERAAEEVISELTGESPKIEAEPPSKKIIAKSANPLLYERVLAFFFRVLSKFF